MNTSNIIIEAIETDICYFIRVKRDNYTFYNGNAGVGGLDNYIVNGIAGKSLERTHSQSWVKIINIPTKLQQIVPQPNINGRYELIDKNLVSDRIPLLLTLNDIKLDDGIDTPTGWNKKYEHLYSLYKFISDPQPPKIEDEDFKVEIILKLDNIKEYGGFSYPVQRTKWENEGFVMVTDKDVRHHEVDIILFPDIILPARKSELTSEQTYKIIRKHIQDNINAKYAHITSDYDFCFTVKKKIPLSKPRPHQKNISKYGARKPKYVTTHVNDREIQIFEMTHAVAAYNNYTVIDGFKGNNIEELKENIDNYLTDLMTMINTPLVDCPTCCGKGVINP